MPRARLLSAVTSVIPEGALQRTYAFSIFINSVGFGLVIPAVALYFTQVVGLSGVQVGLGFTISGLVALVAGPPAGRLADRRGPREGVLATMVLQSVAAFAYLFVQEFVSFVVIATIEMLVTGANMAAAGALTRRVGGADAVTLRSSIRAVSNLGTMLGVGGAAIAIQVGTPFAYRTVLAVNAASFLVAALLMLRVPHYPPLSGHDDDESNKWIALRDKPFLTYTAVSGLMSMQYYVLDLALPVWVVAHTDAPRWSVSLFIIVNTLMVVLLQVRFGKKVQSVRQGGHALRRAGFIFLVSCAAIGAASWVSTWLALAILVAAIVVHTLGELTFSTGSFALDFGLAPEEHQGEYQGLVGIGGGLGSALAPVVLIGWVLAAGPAGWAVLGAFFLLLGLFGPAVARWGAATRTFPVDAEVGEEPAHAASAEVDTEPTARAAS